MGRGFLNGLPQHMASGCDEGRRKDIRWERPGRGQNRTGLGK